MTLLSFIGEKLNKSSLLKWETESEINNDYFILEKSSDGINFKEIAEIAGAGNSNIKLLYSFEDTHPYIGENFYRLKQIDYNGKFEQYKPIIISFENSSSPININLYPNPITDDNDLIISCSEFNQDSKITIIDIKGSIINIEYTITEGQIILSTSNLDKGVYFALFNVENKQLKEMFIVE